MLHRLFLLSLCLYLSGCAAGERQWVFGKGSHPRDPKISDALHAGTEDRWQRHAAPVICLSHGAEEHCITPDTYRIVFRDQLLAAGVPVEEYGEQLRWRIPVIAMPDIPSRGQPLTVYDEKLAGLLKQHDVTGMQIIGHGNPSERRYTRRWARAYADGLMKLGIAPERLFVEDAGSDDLLAGSRTEEGRRLNRRLEIRMLLP